MYIHVYSADNLLCEKKTVLSSKLPGSSILRSSTSRK